MIKKDLLLLKAFSIKTLRPLMQKYKIIQKIMKRLLRFPLVVPVKNLLASENIVNALLVKFHVVRNVNA